MDVFVEQSGGGLWSTEKASGWRICPGGSLDIVADDEEGEAFVIASFAAGKWKHVENRDEI